MKAIVSLLSLLMSVGFSDATAQAQPAANSLQVYAGPQTALPLGNISVTIEMTDGHGSSVQGETIQLTYISDGVPMTMSGKVSNGLVSFSLSWIDSSGVKRSEAAQLSNSSMSYMSICPQVYIAPLKVRAVLKNVEVFSSDLSALCELGKESA